ncbi:AAA family ATPase (plasmid) [Halobaculum magnesiiphilum]|uniref:AAA family ATPase n=2 Tax=Halobaculum magnesiiphilum TaxID=1017351 RepID=A0A8T8WH85_9EURY|nr:AAA family ATPase [Halobaculum magnesiiphilum]
MPEREEELSDLKKKLRPAVLGGTPSHGIIFGSSGQGKTLSIRLMTELTKDACEEEQIDFTTIWVDCEGAGSSHAAIGRLINSSREKQGKVGNEDPIGHHQVTLFNRASRELREIGGTIVVVLDGVEDFEGYDYILYALSEFGGGGVRVGVLVTSTDFGYRGKISAGTKSRIGPFNIHFDRYRARDIENIIKRRCVAGLQKTGFEQPETYDGFHSEYITDDAINLCATHASSEKGDARRAIMILKRAVAHVDNHFKRDTIRREDIDRAIEQIEKEITIKNIIQKPTPVQFTLLCLVKNSLDGCEWVRTAHIKSQWDSDVTLWREGVVHRTIHSYLKRLEASQLVDKEYRSSGSDSSSDYWKLTEPVELVLESIKTTNDPASKYASKIIDSYEISIENERL